MDFSDIYDRVKLILGYIDTDEAIDSTIALRINTVAGFMLGAGIVEEVIKSDTGIGAIAIGVQDLMNTKSSEVKFSQVFIMMISQLKYR